MLEKFVQCTTGALECVAMTHSELLFVLFLVFMAGFVAAFSIMLWAQAGREAILLAEQQQQRQQHKQALDRVRLQAQAEFSQALRQPAQILKPDLE